MTREEVLEKLKTLGVSISGETLRRWINARLLPTPERGNIGRNGGRWSNHPLETPWEAFAAWHLLKDNSINKVALIRNNALPFIDNICDSELQELNAILKEWQKENESSVTGEISSAKNFTENNKPVYVDSLIFEWLMLRIKSEYDISINTPARVQIEYWGKQEKKQPSVQFLKEFSSELTKTAWQIKNVLEYTKDEIFIEDINTGTAIVLKCLLQYLYRFDAPLR